MLSLAERPILQLGICRVVASPVQSALAVTST